MDSNGQLGELGGEIIHEFLADSLDGLETVSRELVAFEADPSNLSTINAIFRPVHSLKGNAAFFGLLQTKELAHRLESLLDLLRKEQLRPDDEIMDVLLAGTDELATMLTRVRDGGDEVLETGSLDDLLRRVTAACDRDKRDTNAVLNRLVEKLDSIATRLAKKDKGLLGEVEGIISEMRAVSRPVSSADDERAPADVPATVAEIRTHLDAPIEGTLDDESAQEVRGLVQQLLDETETEAGRDKLTEMLGTIDIFLDGAIGFDDLLRETIRDTLQQLEQQNAWAGTADPAAGQDASADVPAADTRPRQEAPAKTREQTTQKTMRVPEESIDNFLGYVGELLVVGDMFNHLATALRQAGIERELAARFKRTNDTFAALSNNLQKSIMEIRKVRISVLFNKVPRMVRDIASAGGKEIVVEIEGQDLEVDKSLVDLFDAPLTHMVRNAADHGVEPPDEREAAGKPTAGTITVRATETSTTVDLSVSDDGAGIDYDAIRAKAEENGVIAPGETLDQDRLVDLLFAAGVSTAQAVTDISGRGVGMDVVRRMIDDGGGTISITSEPGRGSTFTISMPRSITTQILSGFMIEVGGERYVLPLEKVLDTSAIAPDAVTTVTGRGRCVEHHGSICPVRSLAAALGIKVNGQGQGEGPRDDLLMVRVRGACGDCGLLVDNVLGVQQVVMRELDGVVDTAAEAVVGGALMGDGSVALVLDPTDLATADVGPAECRSDAGW